MVLKVGMGQMFDSSCGSLLKDLQLIWDEIGENDEERDKTLLQIEQECLDVYRQKVEHACNIRTNLQQYLSEIEVEITQIYSLLGDSPIKIDRHPGNLRQQIAFMEPYFKALRQKKEERAMQLRGLRLQIQKIKCEFSGAPFEDSPLFSPANEDDLSLRTLDKYQAKLQVLQKEENDRLQRVLDHLNTLHQLCSVLAVDFFKAVNNVHPSLHVPAGTGQLKSISDKTIDGLVDLIKSLAEEKRQRMQKLQELGTSLVQLWTLMDTSAEEQQMFQHVTSQLAASEREITAPGALDLDTIKQAEIEVERLTQRKGSRIKELVLKKRAELEDICRRAHMDSDAVSSQETVIALVDSGIVGPSELLESVEEQIGKAKEEAFSRKEIMDRMEKWVTACEEESWLEEYNKDDNRYNASRGAHINLKRAEKARAAVSKIPALVEFLASKARAWEEQRGKPFMYDGIRLLAIFEEYNQLREEKEEQKRRLRDKKRIQEQLVNEQETLFGSRPSPNKCAVKKPQASFLPANGTASPTNNHRPSLVGAMLQTPTPELFTRSRLGTSGTKESKREQLHLHPTCGPVGSFMSNEEDKGATSPGAGTVVDMPAAVSEKNGFALQSPRTPLSPVPLSIVRSNILQSEEELKRTRQLGSPKIAGVKNSSCVSAEHHHHHHYHHHLYQTAGKHAIEYSFEEKRAALPCYRIVDSVT